MKCKVKNRKCFQTIFVFTIGYFEKSVFEVKRVNGMYYIKICLDSLLSND